MFSKILTRIKVVLTAAPTYLVLASTAVSLASGQIAELLPGQAEEITRWTAPIVTALAVAVVIVRSVTTVLPEHRKLTSNVPYAPVPGPAPAPDPAGPAFDKIP
jgi:hypothetical protein